MLIFNDILLLARPKLENNWKLLAEFELNSLHVDETVTSDIPEQEFMVQQSTHELPCYPLPLTSALNGCYIWL